MYVYFEINEMQSFSLPEIEGGGGGGWARLYNLHKLQKFLQNKLL